MRLPNKRQYKRRFLINGEEWRLTFTRNLKHKGEPAWGLTDPVKRLIQIDSSANADTVFRTYVHEVLHALHFEYDFKLKHKQVYRLEQAIADFLLNNF